MATSSPYLDFQFMNMICQIFPQLGTLVSGKGSKVLLKIKGNKEYLADVDEQDGGFKSVENLNHDDQNYEAGTDYTDSFSYEEENDAEKGKGKGNKTEKIKMEKKKKKKGNDYKIKNEMEGDEDDIMLGSKFKNLVNKIVKKKKKKKGNDYSLVGEDFLSKEKEEESKY